jgi:hypothetical protein
MGPSTQRAPGFSIANLCRSFSTCVQAQVLHTRDANQSSRVQGRQAAPGRAATTTQTWQAETLLERFQLFCAISGTRTSFHELTVTLNRRVAGSVCAATYSKSLLTLASSGWFKSSAGSFRSKF